jgi:hypothetical protein
LLAGGCLLAGIGFTMALFIASLAFSEGLIDSAKLGIFWDPSSPQWPASRYRGGCPGTESILRRLSVDAAARRISQRQWS